MSEKTIPSAVVRTLTLKQALDLAVEHHSAGELSKAETVYQNILHADSNQPVALHLLGVIAHQKGDYNQAVNLIERALVNEPNYDEAYSNLGLALQELGKRDEALASFKKAININPEFAEAYNNLGNVLKSLKNLEEAVKNYKRAIKIKPSFVKAYSNLGATLKELGQFDDAIINIRKAISLEPNYAKAHCNLGTVFEGLNRLDEAIACYKQALTLNPNFAEAHYNFANMLSDLGRLDEAVISYKTAIFINPNYAEALNNLGGVLQKLGKTKEAIDVIKKAISLNPDYVVAFNNLGTAFKELGNLEAAEINYMAALAINPNYSEAHNNLGSIYRDLGRFDEARAHLNKSTNINPLFLEAGRNLLNVILNIPGLSLNEQFSEHLRVSEQLTRDIVPPEEEWTNEPSPDRAIRIGYLSSDFRNHPVGFNVLPLISSHDRSKFEVYCYADVQRPDRITEKFRSSVEHWHNITGRTDREVAEMVRAHKIDVLVCLAGRFDNNRPLVCAHRAAPVQISFHDGATSGLEEMDYWLTDEFLHPLDTRELFTEELYRLPVFYQYTKIEEAPPVSSLPSQQSGFITFGSFNSPAKVNNEVIKLWSDVLKSVPRSRILLKYKNWYDQISLRKSVVESFAACGIEQDRITFSVNLNTMTEHLGLYSEVDIALDSFPYSGATTTFQALWMGVPVISLAGETFCSRMAGSILYHVGLKNLVVENQKDYLVCAGDLAGDTTRLSALRKTLRERISTSPLCDAAAYTESVETSYLEMWNTWCTNFKDSL